MASLVGPVPTILPRSSRMSPLRRFAIHDNLATHKPRHRHAQVSATPRQYSRARHCCCALAQPNWWPVSAAQPLDGLLRSMFALLTVYAPWRRRPCVIIHFISVDTHACTYAVDQAWWFASNNRQASAIAPCIVTIRFNTGQVQTHAHTLCVYNGRYILRHLIAPCARDVPLDTCVHCVIHMTACPNSHTRPCGRHIEGRPTPATRRQHVRAIHRCTTPMRPSSPQQVMIASGYSISSDMKNHLR